MTALLGSMALVPAYAARGLTVRLRIEFAARV